MINQKLGQSDLIYWVRVILMHKC